MHFSGYQSLFLLNCLRSKQGLQILLMSGVTMTSASQILESFGIFGVKYHNEKSHFQTFQHVVLACIHYREGYTK